jgi:hypothetical protein
MKTVGAVSQQWIQTVLFSISRDMLGEALSFKNVRKHLMGGTHESLLLLYTAVQRPSQRKSLVKLRHELRQLCSHRAPFLLARITNCSDPILVLNRIFLQHDYTSLSPEENNYC